MRVLISWGTTDNNNSGIGIDADGGGGGGGGISLPSSHRRACRVADLLARGSSYGNLRTPLHKAVAGGWPLAVQLLVRTLHCCGVLWEVMQARDALGRTPLKSAHTYASMPPLRGGNGGGVGSAVGRGGRRGWGRLGNLPVSA